MKIKTIKNYKYNLFKLYLIKSKLYEKKSLGAVTTDSFTSNLEITELHLKNILKIIYEFHVNQKKILFIGGPNSLQKKFKIILKNTHHFIIPESIWVNGLFSNKYAIFQNLKLKRLRSIKKQEYDNNDVKPLLSIKKKPDLVVILDRDAELNAITESYNLRIPVISLNNNLLFDSKSCYRVPVKNKKTNQKFLSIFFTAVSFVLRQP